jgi:hypothetical protein
MMYPPPEKWQQWAHDRATEIVSQPNSNIKASILHALTDAMQWVVDMLELRQAIEQSPDFSPLNADAAKKASGRSTRMLRAAYAAHLKGKAVYVIGLNQSHAKLLRNELVNKVMLVPDETVSSIKFECPDSLGNFDVMTGRWSGRVWSNVEAFVDHAVYLREFGTQWELMSRWDETEIKHE